LSELAARLRLRYRYPGLILRAMVVTDFKLRYQASVLGYLWTLLKPLAIFTTLYLVFVQLLKIGATVPYNAIYLLFGIVIWSLFAEATSTGLTSLVQRADLLRKISFPRYVIVVSVGVSAMITFGLSMIIIVLFMALARVPLTLNLFWLPLLFVELVLLSLAMALFLAGGFVRYRDLSYIWEVVLQAGFYACPIIWPISMIPAKWQPYILLNPMAQIIQDARYCLITDQSATITQVFGSPWVRAIPVGIVLALFVLSVVYFKRKSPHFAEVA
jgi:ABC-2 type transport system permease protein